MLIDDLFMTRNVYNAAVYAFCILPDHMHILVGAGEKGLSRFMHSFRRNASRDVGMLIPPSGGTPGLRTPAAGNDMSFTGWQSGFHDRYVTTDRKRMNAFYYVAHNAVRHRLVTDIDDWPWSSIHFPHLIDPLPMWD